MSSTSAALPFASPPRLVSGGQILKDKTEYARGAVRRAASRRGVTLLEGDPVVEVRGDKAVLLASGRAVEADACIW